VRTQAEAVNLNRRLATNFTAREFICSCCGAEGIKDDLVFHLQMVRDLLSIHRVMIITSGYRCEKHNREVGGIEGSAHIKGLAADIKYDDVSHKFMLIHAIMKVGFKRIGIYDSFIHVDLDETKAQMVMW